MTPVPEYVKVTVKWIPQNCCQPSKLLSIDGAHLIQRPAGRHSVGRREVNVALH